MSLVLSACGTPAAEQVRYTGNASPESVNGGSECGPSSPATLIASKGHFSFTPTDGVLILNGEVASDGAVEATLTLAAADRKPFVLRFTGHLDDLAVTGRYVTPRCAFIVELHRNRARQFEVPYL